MFRFVVLGLCISSIWAVPFSTGHSKVLPFKLTGPRIINGDSARDGQFPWQAALFVAGGDGSWFCGGSIIGEEWILTAGHCVNGARSAQVVTGSTDAYRGDVSDASNFVLHEQYDQDQLSNDIGLVRLDQPLRLGGNTDAVRLDSQELSGGVDVTVSGWGLTSDDSTTISETLNFVELVTISNNECNAYFGQGAIRQEMVCANSPTSQARSTCSGDSGGPVVVNAQSNPVHVAVVSFVSDAGCESGAPSGYTRTAYYRDWIQGHTGI